MPISLNQNSVIARDVQRRSGINRSPPRSPEHQLESAETPYVQNHRHGNRRIAPARSVSVAGVVTIKWGCHRHGYALSDDGARPGCSRAMNQQGRRCPIDVLDAIWILGQTATTLQSRPSLIRREDHLG
jgi:hypothetical protein